AAEGIQGCAGPGQPGEVAVGHDAEGTAWRTVPGNRLGRQRRRSVEVADPALLAGRHRASYYMGTGNYKGTAQETAEPGHLPPAGDRAQQGHHALAGASRRRAGFPRTYYC